MIFQKEIVNDWNSSLLLNVLGNVSISCLNAVDRWSRHNLLTRRVVTEKSRFHSANILLSGDVTWVKRTFRIRWKLSSEDVLVELMDALAESIWLGKIHIRNIESLTFGTLTIYRPGSWWWKHDDR